MNSPSPLRQPVAIDDHARDNLRFIRETMERAGSFTAVPGWGGIAIGITALGAAVVATQQSTSGAWLVVWLVEAAIALAIAGWSTILKARRANDSLLPVPRVSSRSVLCLRFLSARFSPMFSSMRA